MSVQTATHHYSAGEVAAMNGFYGYGHWTCAATRATGVSVPLAHQLPLDPASSCSKERLNWMLERKLLDPRNQAHAGEMRENVIPLFIEIKLRADAAIPCATLFPCEENLLRTLAFEREVKNIRLRWAQSGLGDPGRPDYAIGYPVLGDPTGLPHMSVWGPILPHRLHARKYWHVIRYSDSRNSTLFSSADIPGVPGAAQRFPTISTLLSIPFSLLHNTPPGFTSDDGGSG
ncbi:hypothetical protein B0H19DRAFT_13683 [Mycena capillaripes]|nr:hypothetical protein B0H19DRAFT_13683 [Mycena capillaripes]